uniref:Uncharacterized protein n=1 Tax=Heterorhabditis bacteriophora TaxID=37862 RepID=A0A1I7WER3_HETBA
MVNYISLLTLLSPRKQQNRRKVIVTGLNIITQRCFFTEIFLLIPISQFLTKIFLNMRHIQYSIVYINKQYNIRAFRADDRLVIAWQS